MCSQKLMNIITNWQTCTINIATNVESISVQWSAKRTKNNLSCRRYVQCIVPVLHIGPNLTHWRGSRSGGMLEIWRGHSTGLMHGHSRGAHTWTNDWHSCYSRWGATAPWNWILRRGAKRVSTWGHWRRTFSSPILEQLAPYLLLYNYVQKKNNNRGIWTATCITQEISPYIYYHIVGNFRGRKPFAIL